MILHEIIELYTMKDWNIQIEYMCTNSFTMKQETYLTYSFMIYVLFNNKQLV